MRISDWSSDVCSSDLISGNVFFQSLFSFTLLKEGPEHRDHAHNDDTNNDRFQVFLHKLDSAQKESGQGHGSGPDYCSKNIKKSEEHTSKLQSLMRISYAVFCLKKKKT